MKAIKENNNKINFDFQAYYRKLGQVENELDKIKIEASYFKYYDSLSKDDQIVFKNEDKKIRHLEAEFIRNEIHAMRF